MFLVSSDDVTVEISGAAALLSDLLKGLLEDLDDGAPEEQRTIPMFGVDGQTLTTVIDRPNEGQGSR
ncbi:g734 [Coccomyxa elongata]